MKKIICSAILFWLIIIASIFCFCGCDIDLVTDTVYLPAPIYYVEPCCSDYIEAWIY